MKKEFACLAAAGGVFGLSYAFVSVHDQMVRPRQDENSLYATCEATAPAPAIKYASITIKKKGIFSDTIEKKGGGHFVEFKGCDVARAYILCTGEVNSVANPAITKTTDGYAATRPSKDCAFFYEINLFLSKQYNFDR